MALALPSQQFSILHPERGKKQDTLLTKGILDLLRAKVYGDESFDVPTQDGLT